MREFSALRLVLLLVCCSSLALGSPTPQDVPSPAEQQCAERPLALAFTAALRPRTEQDTSRPPAFSQIKPKLLPDNMSWGERALWGEEGLLRKIGIAGSPLTPEVRKSELTARRTMLTMHQVGGFVTLGLMGATVFYGQRYLDHLQRSDRQAHGTLVQMTILTYSATGLLSVLSPPPLLRREGMNTTSIHKTLAWVHLAGMIATPILGSMISERSERRGVEGGNLNLQKAHVHQIAGYITTAVFTAAMVVMTF